MGLNFLSDAARLKRIADLLQQAESPALPAVLGLLNQALRPASVLSVMALIGLAFADPARYRAGIAALAITPLPVWALCALILGLHFLTKSGARPPRT